MPGFDRSGPRGQGARTGWGRGLCATGAYNGPIDSQWVGRGGGFGSGGRGRGCGRGRGQGWRWQQNSAPNEAAMGYQDLQAEAESLRARLAELERRLSQEDRDIEKTD